MEELFEDLLMLINEVSDELAKRVKEKRRDNWSKAYNLKTLLNSDTYKNEIEWNRKNGNPAKAEEMEKAREKADAEAIEATEKSRKNDYLMDQRRERKAKERKKLEDFKERLLNMKQSPKETQKAGSEHDNAMLDQHLRKKLEKTFSHECFEEICALVEGFINELDDETVNNSAEKRYDNEIKAVDKYLDAVKKHNKNYDAEEVQKAQEEGRIAREKYQKNQELRNKRDKRRQKALDDFKERLLNRKQTPKETQKAGSDHDNAMLDQALRKKLERAFAHEYLEEICSLLEEFINELDDETVENARKKRAENVQKALSNFVKMRDEGTPEEAEKANDEWTKAGKKLCNIDKLRNLRGYRKEENRKALAKFKERLLNKDPQTVKEYKQAAQDHDNAMIDQGLRAKLEKCLKVSESCLDDIMAMIEGFING